MAHSLKRELSIRDDDPLSARYVLTQSFEMGREGWRTRIDVRLAMCAKIDNFHLDATLTAYENDAVVATRDWSETIPRDGL